MTRREAPDPSLQGKDLRGHAVRDGLRAVTRTSTDVAATAVLCGRLAVAGAGSDASRDWIRLVYNICGRIKW